MICESPTRAQLKPSPADTAATLLMATSLGSTGANNPVAGTPACAALLLPQHRTPPAVVTAHAVCAKIDTDL